MPYRYKPLEGLLHLSNELAKNNDLFHLLQKAEEEIGALPEGRSKRLLLFLIIINILQKSGLSFYVKGGIILQYALNEHAREADDIDVVIPNNSDLFFKQVSEALSKSYKGLDFEVGYYSKLDADSYHYYDTFNMMIKVYHQGLVIDEINFEGVRGNLFNEIEPERYLLPMLVEENSFFLGVPIEYVFAEKILAITSELKRPIKHLVDAYSLTNINIDLKKLERYLQIILKVEKPVRERLGVDTTKYEFVVKDDKEYVGSYIFTALSAGYNNTQKEMTDFVNEWLKKIG